MGELVTGSNVGKIKIADNVAAAIANIAAQEVEGVVKVTGSSTSSISEMFGRKNLSKGVKVSMEDEATTVELALVVEHGVNLVELAQNVQKQVKDAIESMTGLEVKEVDVTISDIVFEDPKKAGKGKEDDKE